MLPIVSINKQNLVFFFVITTLFLSIMFICNETTFNFYKSRKILYYMANGY